MATKSNEKRLTTLFKKLQKHSWWITPLAFLVVSTFSWFVNSEIASVNKKLDLIVAKVDKINGSTKSITKHLGPSLEQGLNVIVSVNKRELKDSEALIYLAGELPYERGDIVSLTNTQDVKGFKATIEVLIQQPRTRNDNEKSKAQIFISSDAAKKLGFEFERLGTMQLKLKPVKTQKDSVETKAE